MASTIPAQYRAVDPFASYNSSTVNQLTEMRSRAENVLDIPCGLDVVLDSTSPLDTVVVQPGYAFKDDVMISITEEHEVDFTVSDNYISFGTGFDETGNYYIVLEYTYIKSRPAPQAKIKIVKPSQTGSYYYGNSISSLMFLKSVTVIWTGSEFNISSLSDADGSIERRYTKEYAGSVTTLPTWTKCRDQGRFAYDVTTDQFWFGYADRWEQLNIGSTFNIDTLGLTIGDLCYVNSGGAAALAESTSIDVAAEMVVIEVGTAVTGTGQTRLSGYVTGVNVEAANSPIRGDLLYLSKTDAGTVTDTPSNPLYQVVGRALTNESSTPGKVDILFFARAVQETNTTARVATTIPAVESVAGWTTVGAGSYHDINITNLGLVVDARIVTATCWWSNLVISPQDIEATSDTNIRIWMPDNTLEVKVAIVG